MQSEDSPLTEIGRDGWVAAAKQHSMAARTIRGRDKLDSENMGFDMCAGCCQIDIHERLSAAQVASHPFILSCRKWSAEMDMISSLARLLRHMAPGDFRGHGSHEWMMTTLPEAHQDDWALELIGSLIKYPFAVEIFVSLATPLGPRYSAKSLVDVLLQTAVRAAHCLTSGSETAERCRGQMKVLDAQGACRFQGLPRILQTLGLLKNSQQRH